MKNNYLKFLNPILALLFILTLVAVGLYKFGPASLRGSEAMEEFHQFCGIIFFLVALLHVYFNWTWVKTNILGIKKHKKGTD